MKNDSKITRAERTLEKTVQQAEFIAGQIAKNAADGCFVACPECGQLIPTPYSGFISREAADRYARWIIAIASKSKQGSQRHAATKSCQRIR